MADARPLDEQVQHRVDDDQFALAGVAPDARPEQLDVVAWGRLAEAVAG